MACQHISHSAATEPFGGCFDPAISNLPGSRPIINVHSAMQGSNRARLPPIRPGGRVGNRAVGCKANTDRTVPTRRTGGGATGVLSKSDRSVNVGPDGDPGKMAAARFDRRYECHDTC